MPTSSTKAFVLSSVPFGEQDKLVQLLSENWGILKGIAPGAQKVRNRFGSIFELLTEGEFFYYWKETNEMVTISKGDIVQSHFNLVSDVGNIFYFYLIAEVILTLTPFHHKEARIYRLVATILENRKAGVDMNLLFLYFLVWILRIEGLMFNPGICYNCFRKEISPAWLKVDFRGILCHQCRRDERLKLNQNELNFLKWTETHSPAALIKWRQKLNTSALIRTFKEKIEHHTESNLKSAQMLAEFK